MGAQPCGAVLGQRDGARGRGGGGGAFAAHLPPPPGALRRTVRYADTWFPASNNPKNKLDTLDRLKGGIARARKQILASVQGVRQITSTVPKP